MNTCISLNYVGYIGGDGGNIRPIHGTHPFGSVLKTHVKNRSRRFFEPDMRDIKGVGSNVINNLYPSVFVCYLRKYPKN